MMDVMQLRGVMWGGHISKEPVPVGVCACGSASVREDAEAQRFGRNGYAVIIQMTLQPNRAQETTYLWNKYTDMGH